MSQDNLRPFRGRPAHTQGAVYCSYTADGKYLVTAGANDTIRLYKSADLVGDPLNIDECAGHNTAVAAAQTYFVSGSEDGTVSLYLLTPTPRFERFLTRCSLPIRDIALSKPDDGGDGGAGCWCAIASDELAVRLLQIDAPTRVISLRQHTKPARHVSFDLRGRLLALSATDGNIYIYSLLVAESEGKPGVAPREPELIRTVRGVVAALHGDMGVDMLGVTSRVVWHPDGRAFAAPTPTRDVQVLSKADWELQSRFADGHTGDITALAWSPNGAMLITAARDHRLLLWETKTQSVIARYDYNGVTSVGWHPTQNLVAFTTWDGEVYICDNFIPEQFVGILKLKNVPAPLKHDQSRAEIPSRPRPRRGSLGSMASLLDDSMDGNDYGNDDGGDLDDFIVDDEGGGEPRGRKRPREDDQDEIFGIVKRQHLAEPIIHASFQPGSTPWRGNRKYLCLNLIGFVWTVDQDDHNTVTVEFYDNEVYRNFHFTDTFLYDMACLNEQGTLFSCPARDAVDMPSTVMYRPHETWTQRHDWHTQLPSGEEVVAMSLGENYVTVTTTAGYVRIFTLFGIPIRVYRPKSMPVVTCAAWRDYVLILGNGPVGADGRTRLLYSIENIKRGEVCQNDDVVALMDSGSIKSVFWSAEGDPCIYDNTGTLLTLLHWRHPGRALWVPLLDTRLLPRLASGKKSESYYPVAVAYNKFHCIILKGGEQYPYFPRPLLSEFEFAVPLTETASKSASRKPPRTARVDGNSTNANDDADDDIFGSVDKAREQQDNEAAEVAALHQRHVVLGIAAAQLADRAAFTAGGEVRDVLEATLARTELDIDKALLQLLAAECRAGEDCGMRALEFVTLMRDASGRMIEAAGKVADRYQRSLLADKIRELGEARVAAAGFGEDERDGVPY